MAMPARACRAGAGAESAGVPRVELLHPPQRQRDQPRPPRRAGFRRRLRSRFQRAGRPARAGTPQAGHRPHPYRARPGLAAGRGMSARQPSLRRRLLLVAGIGLVLVSVLASVLLGELFKRSARDRLDHELQQDMLPLLAQAEVDPEGQLRLRQEPNDARFQRVFSGAYWQIADQQGKVLLQSRSLWDQTLAATADGPTQRNLAGPMQQSLRARVQQVRLPRAAQAYVAVVANDRSALDADVAAFRQRTAIALAVLVAAWLAVLASQVHFGLRPLRGLRQQLERIRRGEAERIDRRQLDLEIAPLADELDALLDHHQRMVARARSSAEDLAHALKTPLSVLAAETQGDGRDWRRTLHEQGARMRASIDRYLAAGLARCAG
ncbi:hypothetical protein G6F22_014125 [Rhizopus arrhizus]|nr:hypothetical protein G6F22_014125 [Rhizopus arrhizus]